MDTEGMDPIRDAIENGWLLTVYLGDYAPVVDVTALAATTAYLACEDKDGNAIIIPWARIFSVRIEHGSGRAL
jgi:hypothetical protein